MKLQKITLNILSTPTQVIKWHGHTVIEMRKMSKNYLEIALEK